MKWKELSSKARSIIKLSNKEDITLELNKKISISNKVKIKITQELFDEILEFLNSSSENMYILNEKMGYLKIISERK